MAAGAQRRDGRIAAALEHRLDVDDGIARRDLCAVQRHLAALPLDAEVRLVVEFDVAHARRNVIADRLQLAWAEDAGIGLRPVDAHDRHDVVLEQQVREVQRAIVLGDFDPLDAHIPQARQPDALDFAETDRRGIAGVPMHADAGIIFGTWIITQVHINLRETLHVDTFARSNVSTCKRETSQQPRL